MRRSVLKVRGRLVGGPACPISGRFPRSPQDDKVTLKEVLEREDSIVGKTYVRRLLESLPGIGKVRAGQLLADLGISERRRVQGLGARQKERLLELFPPRT
ncbi:integration host factor, actinobacterial type [Streptomyces sp. NPDC006984]|uniref:integration host factor, actinobacterial type n=1 Tax=Streptomyces sp. NPDC006984 TaxID=3155463 RepID=UPI0033EDC382